MAGIEPKPARPTNSFGRLAQHVCGQIGHPAAL